MPQEAIIFQIDRNLLKGETSSSDRLVYSHYFKALSLKPVDMDPPNASQDINVIRQVLQSEMGYLFFDRARIRPRGFALGEHLLSLSLAPGEEVVLEQRTFSKRETTFEEQSEQEQQIDLELSSTLSTELAEGVDRETTKTDQTGFNIGGSLGADIAGIQVNVDAGYSRNVSEASTESRKRSVKDSATATSKVASKYRAMHKTIFKVSTEDRFERGAKRVVRNPMAYTPMDLHYFKLLQTLELTQERYAVRLCWAPAIANPAAEVVTRIEAGRRAIVERALSQIHIPPRPEEPPRPEMPPTVATSPKKEADKWGLSGDMSANYDLEIPIPSGYVWDGDVDEVTRLTLVWSDPKPRDFGWNVVGIPIPEEGQLSVRIHVGAGSWIGGPQIFMKARALFIAKPPEEDSEYKRKYEEWLAAVAQWEAEKAARLDSPRRQAEVEADEWERTMIDSINPVVALMDRIAKTYLLGELSDEPWEVEFWGQIFDWQRAGISLYPSWWSTQPARDYLKAPDHFLNASWAKLYLPVKPGFERLGLRWIVGKVRDKPLDEATEEAIARIASELAAYRNQAFGDERETKLGGTGGDKLEEQFLTLGRWTETVPTDGTHLEVVQAMTTAVDDVTKAEIEDLHKTRVTRVADEEQDVEMKKKALAQIGAKPPNVDVRIATEPGADFGSR